MDVYVPGIILAFPCSPFVPLEPGDPGRPSLPESPGKNSRNGKKTAVSVRTAKDVKRNQSKALKGLSISCE